MSEPLFASGVVRSQGRRPRGLAQVLGCLAAQEADAFDVILVVHGADESGMRLVESTVAALSETIRGRVQIVEVTGGGRSTPLNVGLDAARGRYVAFVDDDDLVEPRWIGAFRAGADVGPGTVVRARCAEQPWHGDRETGDPIEPAGPVGEPWAPRFELLRQIHHNETPICSFALPLGALRSGELRFDEGLPVLEDWDLFMRAVFRCGITDVDERTSLYRRISTGTSRDVHADDVWASTIPIVRAGWEQDRLPLPGEWATTLAISYETELKLRDAVDHLQESANRLQHENGELRARVNAVEGSRWWRLTGPLRMLSGVLRGR